MSSPLAHRMSLLAPYLFADLDRKKEAAKARGVDVIALTIGDPDIPTPPAIVAAGAAALRDPETHRYPAYAGSPVFRQAAAEWFGRRYQVKLDPDQEVLALIGTKEGIGHLMFALVDPGDVVLCPDPGYPVYSIATRLSGGEPYFMPLTAEHGFVPDLDAIPKKVAGRAKALWINYPNNPTAAVAERAFLEKAVAFAHTHGCILCVDSAYSEIAFDGYRAPSVLELPDAREVTIEFHSLSKTYSMCGWRIGFAVGARALVGALGTLKNNLDSGVFQAVQLAGVEALRSWPKYLPELLATYQRRRDVLITGLRAAGYAPPVPRATFYVWMPVPGGDDVGFAGRLIEQVGVMVTPGSGFGPSGKGYVRFSLTVDESRLQEAAARIKKAGLSG
jgi:LL-diaminopimelate aminotransferase